MSYSMFRDDDISYTTNIQLLMQAHDIITGKDRVHTVAVQMYRLWENKEVWFFLMTAKNLAIGLHGWEHSDYSKMKASDIIKDFKQCLSYWHEKVNPCYTPPKIALFLPPWNRVSEDLKLACKTVGLRLDARVGGDVYNFHYWELIYPERVKALEQACAS